MFVYNSRLLTRAEVWFDDPPGDTRSVDWVFYSYRSSRVPGSMCRQCHTYVIDLLQPADTLWARLGQDTAYKIRRARDRDKITCRTFDSADRGVLDAFERMYNGFATLKGLLPLDRRRLEGIGRAGVLDISAASDASGNVLVYHANYRDGQRASQMYLLSLYRGCSDTATRNAVGRANRYLIWADILRYKDEGLQTFDFGGWYTGADPQMLKINEFKRGFGGDIVPKYKCEKLLTAKARALVFAARLWRKARNMF